MIKGQGYSMVWEVHPVKIENNFLVKKDDKNNQSKKYNPFIKNTMEDNMFLKFIRIKEDNNQEIKNFIEQYGFLRNHNKESLSYIKAEIICFRAIIKAHLELKKSDLLPEELQLIRAHLDTPEIFLNPILMHENYPLASTNLGRLFDYKDTEKTKYILNSLLIKYINERIYFVFPVLTMDNNKLSLVWNSKDLISAMYLMFALHLAENKILKKCQNENCNEYFAVKSNDKKIKYCCKKCGRSQRQSEYRKNEKIK